MRSTTTNLALRIDEGVKEDLAEYAESHGHSYTWIVEVALRKWLDAQVGAEDGEAKKKRSTK